MGPRFAVPVEGRSPSGVHEVKDVLERLIFSGEFEAGARLNENALATQLDVSRPTIREAVRILESNGLVETVRNKGAIVRNIDLARIVQLYDVRAGLNRAAGRLLAAKATNEQITALNTLHEEMAAVRDSENPHEYHEINMRFHAALMAYTDNPVLIEFDTIIENQCRIFFRHGIVGPMRLRISHAEHASMLEAIVAGDPDRAAEAFERHIIAGKQRMLESIGERIRR